jgi:hypothetical protein
MRPVVKREKSSFSGAEMVIDKLVEKRWEQRGWRIQGKWVRSRRNSAKGDSFILGAMATLYLSGGKKKRRVAGKPQHPQLFSPGQCT